MWDRDEVLNRRKRGHIKAKKIFGTNLLLCITRFSLTLAFYYIANFFSSHTLVYEKAKPKQLHAHSEQI
jgi:hypothetical protein